jgi:hypothetical protein
MPACGNCETPVPEEGETMDAADFAFLSKRLYGQLDRQSDNSVNFTKILDMQYANSQAFRDATASRIVLEAGSGRTRAETNLPAATSAAGNGTAAG